MSRDEDSPVASPPVRGAAVGASADHRRRRFDWPNLTRRIISGVVLAGGTLGAVWVFSPTPDFWRAPFILLVAGGAVLLAFEWSAMATPKGGEGVRLATALAVLVTTLFAFLGRYELSGVAIAVGAILAGLAARRGGDMARDGAYGVFYIAPACLALAWLIQTPQGVGWTLMLFTCTWAADIAAYAVGNLLGGPKLWPRYSPNKTWAGFVGGLAGATAAATVMAALFMHLSLAGAALIGFVGGLATMAGDLWESMLKRRFGVKDSGDLIPGHGGLLDRVDGMMFAVMVFAVARLVVKLGWAH